MFKQLILKHLFWYLKSLNVCPKSHYFCSVNKNVLAQAMPLGSAAQKLLLLTRLSSEELRNWLGRHVLSIWCQCTHRRSGNAISFYPCVGLMGFLNSSRAHFFRDAERNMNSFTQWLRIALPKPFALVHRVLMCSTKRWTVSKERIRISFNRVKSQ